MRYHCCPSSCICYTDPYETLNKCPKCNTDCYKANGTTPQAIYEYLSIILHLHTMLASSSYATKMQYRSKHKDDPMKITNIFDGTHYCSLWETFIMIGNEELPIWFFSNHTCVVHRWLWSLPAPYQDCMANHFIQLTPLLKSGFSSTTLF